MTETQLETWPHSCMLMLTVMTNACVSLAILVRQPHKLTTTRVNSQLAINSSLCSAIEGTVQIHTNLRGAASLVGFMHNVLVAQYITSVLVQLLGHEV